MCVLRLSQYPHQLCHGGFQCHVVSLQQAEFLFDGATDLVNGHIAALIGHLGSHDDGLAERDPFFDGFVKIPAVIGRKAAYAEGFNDDGVVMLRHIIQNIGPHGRNQFQQGNVGIQRVVKMHVIR